MKIFAISSASTIPATPTASLGHWVKTVRDTAEPKSQGFFYILIEINAKVLRQRRQSVGRTFQ
jgi:hypothetical protein